MRPNLPYDPINDDDWTAERERAAILSWLRTEAARRTHGYDSIRQRGLLDAVEAIEAGIPAREATLNADDAT